MRSKMIMGLGLLLTACGGGDYDNLANTPPQAFFNVSTSIGFAPLIVNFDGQRSSDPDGIISQYRWDFGDGSTATGMQVSHTFSTTAGTGSFGPGINISSDANDSTSAVLVDIDGDGDLDLVVGNSGAPNRLYINDGLGNFSSGSDISTDSDNTTAVVLGDIDGDLDLDLVVGNSFTQHSGPITAATNSTPVRITSTDHGLNTGQQLSIANTAYGIDNADYTITVIDTDTFSLDGTLAATNKNGVMRTVENTTPIQITSTGHSLTTGQTLFITNTGLSIDNGNHVITIIDANTFSLDSTVAVDSSSTGNWIQSIASWAYSTASNRLYINDGIGNFSPGKYIHNEPNNPNDPNDSDNSTAVVLGDIDGDGDLDLIVGNAGVPNRLYLNDGTGHFLAGNDISSDSDNTTAIALGDVDNDGDLDLIVGNAITQQRGLITAATNSTPVQITSTSHGLTTGQTVTIAYTGYGIDNADYTITFINANTFSLNGTVTTITQNGVITTVANTTPIRITSSDHGLSSGQRLVITGTGIIDGSYNITKIDSDTFNLNDTSAAGTSSSGRWINPTASWSRSIAINKIYLNNGSGFSAGTDIAPLDNFDTRAIVLGDVDDDGNLDILTGNTAANRLYLGRGDGTFSPGLDITTVNKSTYSLALVDMDNDADLDVIAGNYLRQPNQIFLNGGLGAFSQGPITATESQNTRAIVVGDVNGDGNPDIIAINDGVGNSDSGATNRLSLNGGGYTVTLTVTDNEGATATTTTFINVSGN